MTWTPPPVTQPKSDNQQAFQLPAPVMPSTGGLSFNEEAIQKLHSIIMGELFVHSGYLHYADMIEEICDLYSQVNMQGALSSEMMTRLRDLYNNEIQRTFWGTVAANMEYYLKTKHGKSSSIRQFIGSVVNSLRVTDEELSTPSEMEVALARPRVAAEGSHDFVNPVDFWVICLLAFRMTVGSSQVYPYIRGEYARTKAAERPRPPAKVATVVAAQ